MRPDDDGRALGPPTAENVVATPPNTEANTKPQCRVHSMPRRPQLGRYAAGWRHGFTAGAVDALRQAGRQLPPESWQVVEALAETYELAGSDE
jgi:hypothetical protein